MLQRADLSKLIRARWLSTYIYRKPLHQTQSIGLLEWLFFLWSTKKGVRWWLKVINTVYPMSCCNEMWHLGGPRHHHPPKCLNLPITSPHGNGTPDDNSPHFPECSACLATVDTNLPWDDFLAFWGVGGEEEELGSKDLGQHLGVFVMICEAFLKGFHHEGNARSCKRCFFVEGARQRMRWMMTMGQSVTAEWSTLLTRSGF